jgi:hypothetical protein
LSSLATLSTTFSSGSLFTTQLAVTVAVEFLEQLFRSSEFFCIDHSVAIHIQCLCEGIRSRLATTTGSLRRATFSFSIGRSHFGVPTPSGWSSVVTTAAASTSFVRFVANAAIGIMEGEISTT